MSTSQHWHSSQKNKIAVSNLYLILPVFLKITLVSNLSPRTQTIWQQIVWLAKWGFGIEASCCPVPDYNDSSLLTPMGPDSRPPIRTANITRPAFPPRALGSNVRSSQALEHIVKLARRIQHGSPVPIGHLLLLLTNGVKVVSLWSDKCNSTVAQPQGTYGAQWVAPSSLKVPGVAHSLPG